MVVSVDADEAFDKIQHLFMAKTPRKIVIWGDFLYLLKGICKQLTANIIPDDERPNAFSLRLGRKQGCLLSLLLFNIVM